MFYYISIVVPFHPFGPRFAEMDGCWGEKSVQWEGFQSRSCNVGASEGTPDEVHGVSKLIFDLDDTDAQRF